MANVQCPNCGGYKTSVRDQGAGCALLWIIFGGWLFFVGGLFIAGSSYDSWRGFQPEACLGGVALMALGIGPYILAVRRTNPNLLECAICGNAWDQSGGVVSRPQRQVQSPRQNVSRPATSATSFCPRCAHSNRVGAKFCARCGQSL